MPKLEFDRQPRWALAWSTQYTGKIFSGQVGRYYGMTIVCDTTAPRGGDPTGQEGQGRQGRRQEGLLTVTVPFEEFHFWNTK